jgi:Rrf2 family iron-sulfur cluster assembly transcriptional regulator
MESAKVGMDILRRNTDYALRLMISLARNYKTGSVSTRTLAQEQEVSYQLACKLMQRLHDARLVDSCMGPRGGFRLSRTPGQISLLEVVEVIQGPVTLNRCLMSDCACPRGGGCAVRVKITELQGHMEEYLRGVTVGDLVEAPKPEMKRRQLNRRSK